jgi:glyoxylase-like metal-dependent hydrolase (beta-lactamase superfamily II)
MSFQVGAATVTPVVEMVDRSFDFLAFLPKATEDALRANLHWMAPHHFDPASRRVLLSMHSWLVEAGGKRILIDSCVGNGKQRDARPDWCNLSTAFLDRLADAGARPEDIDYVLCTHLHADHVGWNTRLLDGRWVPTFPNATYVFSRQEYAFWEAEHRAGKAGPHLQAFRDSVLPVIEAGQVLIVEDRDEIAGLLQLEPAPGHTRGHVAVWLEGGRGGVASSGVFTGDILHHPVQVLNPHWSCMGCLDPEQAAETRIRVLARCAAEDTILFPGHFMSPRAARITKANDGFAFRFLCEEVGGTAR